MIRLMSDDILAIPDLWITRKQMESICPSCAKTMKRLRLTKVNVAALKQMPDNMLAGLCEKFGGEDGFRTRCMEGISDKIDDAGAFCNWLENECHGTWAKASMSDHESLIRFGELIEKRDEADHGFILGPVLVPDEVDLQGDSISSEEIEKAAHRYMIDSQTAGVMHQKNLSKRDIVLVESYVARDNMTINGVAITKGTWLAGFRVYDEKIRKMIRDGTFRGFSIGGSGESERAA